MSLFIRDQEVNALAEKVQQALGTRTKTEAVRTALLLALALERDKSDCFARNADLIARTRALGERDPAFNLKAFRNEMWDEPHDD